MTYPDGEGRGVTTAPPSYRGHVPPASPPPTINDVARLSGYSRTTVSNALNGRGRISERTVAQVKAAAARLGYRPSRTARALRTSRTRTIALLLPPWHHIAGVYLEFYLRIISAVTTRAFSEGISVLLTPPLSSPEDARNLEVDGAIVCDPTADVDRIAMLEQAGVPLVTYEQNPFTATPPAVLSDNRANLRLLLDHLREAGARRVGLVMPDRPAAALAQMRDEYATWCVEHDTPSLLLLANSEEPTKRLERFLNEASGPDAVIDLVHPLVSRMLQKLGRTVPQDVLLATYVNASSLESETPPVTAVDLDPESIGVATVESLLKLLTDAQTDHNNVVPARLCIRQSSGDSPCMS